MKAEFGQGHTQRGRLPRELWRRDNQRRKELTRTPNPRCSFRGGVDPGVHLSSGIGVDNASAMLAFVTIVTRADLQTGDGAVSGQEGCS
jgi:hypothetical protein